MNLTRIWIAGGVLAVAAVLAGGWLLAVQPMLAAADDNRAQQASVAALVATQEQQLAELKRQAADRDRLEDDVAELRAALPAGAAMPDLVGELADLAGEAGVRITDLGTSEAQQLASSAGTAAADSAPADSAPAEGEEPAAAAPAASSTTIAIPLQITAEGDGDQLIDFVGRVQNADRLLLPSALTLSLPENADERQVTLSVLAYVSPQP
ncbi:type 4a pilus biogenesis protein PilO [Naasia sp. SYSU D00057]|uniref:type 4a pilus biogenesis protein PilO n=1 Tax=Naasia sp. SYSU D00057 TaxID=2817380 RepID=UPI001B302F58|nr:type 4a pilus biogenesis protein PilO [Naasia sp. SYSU D00057]